MNQPEGSKAERKKARRRQRKTSERAAGRDLDALARDAVEQAVDLAPDVAAADSPSVSERAIDVPVTTVDGARFLKKRINAALASAEWSNEVQVWVWEADKHTRSPLSDSGREHGIELRLEQAARPQP